MKDLNQYMVKDNLCARAIEDFKVTTSVWAWVSENRSLFHSISYGPEGRMRVIDSNLGETCFEHIRTFGNLFRMVESLFDDNAVSLNKSANL